MTLEDQLNYLREQYAKTGNRDDRRVLELRAHYLQAAICKRDGTPLPETNPLRDEREPES